MMNHSYIDEFRKNPGPTCTDFAIMAEQELTAFFGAITELFGPEQAKLSAEDWLSEVQTGKGLPSSMREWRQLTLNVLARLGSRMTAEEVNNDFPRQNDLVSVH